MPGKLNNLLNPKSVAVIGASRSPEKVGAILLKNILESGFPGKVFPVNPKAPEINGLLCYPDITSLPQIPDLALIVLPAPLVNDALIKAGEKGTRNVIIYSAGFKESGAEGEQLEKAITETAQKFSINILGPNCLGLINNIVPINATFAQQVRETGKVSFITQSGAIASSIFDWCNSTGLGVRDFVTIGNKLILNENDFLQYHLEVAQNEEEQQHPVGLYLESISNGTEFLKTVTDISKRNPVFIIKPGKTQAAAKAMQSHTGAIAGEDIILDTALKQAGAIRCHTLEDFFDFAHAFAWNKAPLGPKVAIVSNAGGPGVITADAISEEELELAEFDPQTKEQLMQLLPRSASILNPVDVLGDALADRVASAAEIILKTNEAHALVVILTPQVMTQIEKTAELIGSLAKKYSTPIFCSFMGGSLVLEGEKKLDEYKIPSFRFPDRAIAAISAMYKWKKWQQEHINPNITTENVQINTAGVKSNTQKALAENRQTLSNLESNDVLIAAGIPTPPAQAVANIDEAKAFADKYGWPIVLKLSSPGILHKADIGAIITNISDINQLELNWENLVLKISQLDAAIRNTVVIQAQKQILKGVEVIAGIKRDPTFGPVMLFGAGGRLAELIADRNLCLLPVNKQQAKTLVEKSKIFKMLNGYRGEPPYALDKLYDLMVRLGKIAEETPEISEIEINPVIITLNDVWAVDGRVLVKQGTARPAPALPKFKTATTLSHVVLAGTYHQFTFESETPLEFKPGQYISVKVANTRINSYSLASVDGSNRFDLLVDTAPGGPGSKYFESLKPGDKIAYLGPFGIFTFKPDDGGKKLLFLGTGSGCSPLRSILESALKEHKSGLPMTLYFGLRHTTDVFWKEYFEKLTQDYPNFSFNLSLSKPDESWKGKIGRITELIDKEVTDASDLSAYICGNHEMVAQAADILMKRNCPKERIYFEKF